MADLMKFPDNGIERKWMWKDREDNYYFPHKMETRHLFYTFRMIWNHSMPNDAKIYPYHEYRFGSFYTTEYMMVAARMMFNELLNRDDMPENFIAQLEFMKNYVIKNKLDIVNMKPSISIIAAVANNGVIGRGGELPWSLPEDLARFRRLTIGKVVLMGRKTYESIGKPLDRRINIVLTNDYFYNKPNCLIASSLNHALALFDREIMVIGGASLYEQTLPLAHKMYLTRVCASVEGDTRFPKWDENDWNLMSVEFPRGGYKNQYPCQYETWTRQDRLPDGWR